MIRKEGYSGELNEGDTILQPESYINDNGILVNAETSVSPFVPDFGATNEPIYQPPVINIPEPSIISEPNISTENMSTEEYQEYMKAVAKIEALKSNENIILQDLAPIGGGGQAYANSASEPTETKQFIGIEEFIAISNEGLNIPKESNVIIIPISESKQPELFKAAIEMQLAQPETPIADIISIVVAPLSEIPRAKGQPINESPDAIKNEVLFDQKVTEIKLENPNLSINEIVKTLVETGEKGLTIKQTSFLDNIVNFIYKQIYK